jgi:hypothetical protein
LAEAILKFAADRTLSATMAPACRAAVKAFSVEAYGKRLLEIIEKRQSGASVLRWAGIKPRNTDTETPNL